MLNYPNYYPNYSANFCQNQAPQYQGAVHPQPLQSQQTGYAAPVSCRFVSSEEEARKAQIPFDGTRTLFADFSNGRIYTKMFDFESGTIPFDVYEKAAPAAPPEKQEPLYVALADYQNHMHGLLGRIEELTAEVEKLKFRKAGKKNDTEES